MTASRNHFGRQTTWVAVLDALCLTAGVVLGIASRLGWDSLPGYLRQHLAAWVIFCGTVIAANGLSGSYGVQIRFSRFNLLVGWAFSLAMGWLVLSITSYATLLDTLLGRGVLVLTTLSYSVLWLISKIVLYRYLLRSPRFSYRIAILGTEASAREISDLVENKSIVPAHKVVAFVRLSQSSAGAPPAHSSVIRGIPVIAVTPEEFPDVVRSMGVEVVIIGFQSPQDARVAYPQLTRLRFEGVTVLTALDITEICAGRIPIRWIDETWLMQTSMMTAAPVITRLKQVIDIAVSFLALILAAPFALLIALAIKLSAPASPVFYSQERVGQFGKTFRIHKFRTMIDKAEQAGAAVWSPPNDPRVTLIGRLLRRFRLDEIPQLLNVLRGQMSLVGPRPERPELVAMLEKEIPFYRERENVMPGLTGWAQIRHPYGSSIDDARAKLEYDLYYIKNLSLTLDLQIVLRTIRVVLFGMERHVR